MFFNDRETIIRLTPEWTGERLPDGRPKVPADVLRRMMGHKMRDKSVGPRLPEQLGMQLQGNLSGHGAGRPGRDGCHGTPAARPGPGTHGYRHEGRRT